MDEYLNLQKHNCICMSYRDYKSLLKTMIPLIDIEIINNELYYFLFDGEKGNTYIRVKNKINEHLDINVQSIHLDSTLNDIFIVYDKRGIDQIG